MQRSSGGWGVVAVTKGVPPVGVEPTLGTLLGGRPLPLGYGGEKNSPGCTYSIHASRSANAKRYQFALNRMNCAHSVAGRRAPLGRLRRATTRTPAAGTTKTPLLCLLPLRRYRPHCARG